MNTIRFKTSKGVWAHVGWMQLIVLAVAPKSDPRFHRMTELMTWVTSWPP